MKYRIKQQGNNFYIEERELAYIIRSGLFSKRRSKKIYNWNRTRDQYTNLVYRGFSNLKDAEQIIKDLLIEPVYTYYE